MGTKTLKFKLDRDWSTAGGPASQAQHQSDLENATGGDFDRDHMASSATLATISTTQPVTPKIGELWADSSTSPPRLKMWSGSTWNDTGIGVAATMPATGAPGQVLYDTTLDMLRRWETLQGLTGWHPVDTGYELMELHSAETILANRPVSLPLAPVSGRRQFSSAHAIKDHRAIGILLEEVENAGDKAVVAKAGGGAVVQVYVDDITNAVAVGDALIVYEEGVRSGGPRVPSNEAPYQSGGALSYGEPFAMICEAMSSRSDEPGLVTARMTALGQGRVERFRRVEVLDLGSVLPAGVSPGGGDTLDATNLTDGTLRRLDLTQLPTAVSATTILKDPSHGPLLGVYLTLEVNGDPDGSNNYRAAFDLHTVSSGDSVYDLAVAAKGSSADGVQQVWADLFLPTANEAEDGIGNTFLFKGLAPTSGATILTQFDVFVTGYLR